MSTMARILRLMVDKNASDIYLSAHSPAMIKINGLAIPINAQILPPEAPRALLAEILPPARIEELEEIGELNMGLPMEGLGNFRISGFRQRGSYAAVIRYIPAQIPSLSSLNVPLILADLVMEKRGLILMVGSTGAGKSTTQAAMLDHRNATAVGHILTIKNPVRPFVPGHHARQQQLPGLEPDTEFLPGRSAAHHAGRSGSCLESHCLAAPAAHRERYSRCGSRGHAEHQAGGRAD